MTVYFVNWEELKEYATKNGGHIGTMVGEGYEDGETECISFEGVLFIQGGTIKATNSDYPTMFLMMKGLVDNG